MHGEALLDLIKKSRATGDARIWDTSKHLPYYTFTFNGRRIGGERSVQARLDLLRLPQMHEKRYLDLGCNLGLFAIAAVEQLRASVSVGVDNDRQIIQCARLIATDRAVDGRVLFLTKNMLDVDRRWLAEHAGYPTYDYVSCLSVFRHVLKIGSAALPRLLTIVSDVCTAEFYFENCSKIPTRDIARMLQRRGFATVVKLGTSERQRDLCVARKPRRQTLRRTFGTMFGDRQSDLTS